MTSASPSDALLLGIDVGSSRTKALLLDGAGQVAGAATVPTPFVAGDDGTQTTVASLLQALEQVLGRLGDERARVAGIGITGLAESGAPLDAAGVGLAPIIAWHDRRGEDVAERLSATFGSTLAERIGQRLRSVSSVAKLGWLLDHGLSGVTTWLGMPELCLHALTGAQATECSLAARTGCRDVGNGSWIGEVAEAAGFDVGVFPEVAAAGQVMGRVTSEAARRFGLRSGVPVTVAGHDHLVGMAGSGAGALDLANSVGTAETVVGRSASLPDIAVALGRGVAVSVFPGGSEWAVLASAARSGLALEAAAATLGQTPAELDALAEGTGLLPAPGLADSLRRRQVPALPAGPPGEVWHTLLHELAASTARAVTSSVVVVGARRRLVVYGGGATSSPWLQAKAELTPLPLWLMTRPEAVARGAALYAGTAAGWWPSPGAAPPPELQPVDP